MCGGSGGGGGAEGAGEHIKVFLFEIVWHFDTRNIFTYIHIYICYALRKNNFELNYSYKLVQKKSWVSIIYLPADPVIQMLLIITNIFFCFLYLFIYLIFRHSFLFYWLKHFIRCHIISCVASSVCVWKRESVCVGVCERERDGETMNTGGLMARFY